MPSRKINFSNVFAGQLVGVREVDDQVWQVSFTEYDLGFFDSDPNHRPSRCPAAGPAAPVTDGSVIRNESFR